ncbi:MAG: hypothetical protein ACTHM2_11235 [Afipia sp.]
MDCDTSRKRESESRKHRDPPIAHQQSRKRRKNQYKPGCNQRRQDSSSPDKLRHCVVERGDIAGRRHGGERRHIDPSELMEKLKPPAHRKDRQISRMLKEKIVTIVQRQSAIDHHEIHVGIAPVNQKIADREERHSEKDDDRDQPAGPAKRRERGEGICSAERLLSRRNRAGWQFEHDRRPPILYQNRNTRY